MSYRAALLALVLAGLSSAHPARAGARLETGTARVTFYSGAAASAFPGSASCPQAYLGASLYLPDADVTLVCSTTGAAWYFEAPPMKIDVWSGDGRPAWLTADWYRYEVYW